MLSPRLRDQVGEEKWVKPRDCNPWAYPLPCLSFRARNVCASPGVATPGLGAAGAKRPADTCHLHHGFGTPTGACPVREDFCPASSAGVGTLPGSAVAGP